jgi:hypothetical protein
MAEGKSPTGLPGTGGKGLESLTFEQLQELIRMQGSWPFGECLTNY